MTSADARPKLKVKSEKLKIKAKSEKDINFVKILNLELSFGLELRVER